MPVKVSIRGHLRNLTKNRAQLLVSGGSVGEILDSVDDAYRRFKAKICDEKGQLRSLINIYLNKQDVRRLESLETTVKDGDELSIRPLITGG